VQAQGSNDGVTYVDESNVAILNAQTVAAHGDSGEFSYAFLRFELTFDAQGSGTELAMTTFDVHANLTQQ
jgi:hypothetical protein